MTTPRPAAGAYGVAVAGHAVRGVLLSLAAYNAYNIRMYAIRVYGAVIHEFDPWFNYRATEYLANNGYKAFFSWFDYKSWYPLGRPVGTTIYPGMQITSVLIWRFLNQVLGYEMSLNDVCCYVPVWFGVMATFLLALLTYECSKSANAAVASALLMAVIPAHLMRSVGGGYDNESVAMTAMCLVFYLWCRSLRNDESWPIGALAGLAYVNMVAAWGGFIFVLNMIGAHAALLVLVGRYRPSLHKAYSLWYVVGTLGAMRVPVVGFAPLRSLEQLAPLLLFVGMQVLELCERARRRRGDAANSRAAWKLRLQVGAAASCAVAVCFITLFSTGYFGPISSRVRGLFVKHTRTGNPLVDSVAEHQPASSNAYWHYLHYTVYAAPLGLALLLLARADRADAKLFVALYACFSYFFSSKMVRLIIFLGPVASALSGVALGTAVDWTTPVLLEALLGDEKESNKPDAAKAASASKKPTQGGVGTTKKKGQVVGKTTEEDEALAAAVEASSSSSSSVAWNKKKTASSSKKSSQRRPDSEKKHTESSLEDPLGVFAIREAVETAAQPLLEALRAPKLRVARTVLAAAALACSAHYYKQFSDYAWSLAEGMSQPSIMFRATLRNGAPVLVDDYREAYWWIRDHTPEDARVMAWWDYGYQIGGIANRTTIADGNTWNHEHIATLGRCLTSPEKQAHRIVRHLADYVLVWTGGGGDDLAKSPHMARIGNSVFRDICPDDPTCRNFGFTDRHGTPTPMMAESLLYKLHAHNQKPDVKVDETLFKEVYTSRFNKVRVFKVLKVSQKSKKWVADPANRVCDAPGSWYCVGQYPPALQPLIERRINFAQLEDFNKKRDQDADSYTEAYMKRMSGGAGAGPPNKKGAWDAPDYFEIPDEDDEDDLEENEQADAEASKVADAEYEDFDHEADAAAAAAHAEAAAQQQAAEWLEWSNTEDTTRMWALISSDRVDDLQAWIQYAPAVVMMRSEDGRGPLWWAYEYDRPEIKSLLLNAGCPADATDQLDMTAEMMAAY